MTESNPTITIQIWRQKTSKNCWLSKSVFTFSKQGGGGGGGGGMGKGEGGLRS